MKVVAKLLYGSQNYHLDGSNSDTDYKLLMCPEFNDLYTYHKVDKHDLPNSFDSEHHSVMSVMKFDEGVRKGNVNVLEMLFSQEKYFLPANTGLMQYFTKAMEAYKNGYLGFVWDEYLRTLCGMMLNSLDRYGVNRKSASRGLFLLNFADYVSRNDFVVTNATWSAYGVWHPAWKLRYDETTSLPSREWFVETFETLKKDSAVRLASWKHDNSNYYGLSKWDTFLVKLMRNYTLAQLKKEDFYDFI